MIPRQRTGLPERAMARHHERDRVLPHRGAHRARGLWRLQPGRDVRVADRAAHRDLEQRFPDADLEIGADQDDAQGLVGAPQGLVEDALGEAGGARDVLDVGRAGPAALHVGERGGFLAGVGEGEAGEAARGGHDERHAEWAGVEAVAQGGAGAAGLPFAGRHRLVGDEQIVQPAGA